MYNWRLFHFHSTFFYKIISNKSAACLCSKISFRIEIHNLNLSHRGLLTKHPKHRTGLFKHSFSYQIASVLNSFAPQFQSFV